MKVELLVGIIFLIIGVVVTVCVQDASLDAEKESFPHNIRMLFKNTFGSIFTLLGLLSLSKFLLSITSNDITWKNGIYILLSVCSMEYCLSRFIRFAKRYIVKRRNKEK